MSRKTILSHFECLFFLYLYTYLYIFVSYNFCLFFPPSKSDNITNLSTPFYFSLLTYFYIIFSTRCCFLNTTVNKILLIFSLIKQFLFLYYFPRWYLMLKQQKKERIEKKQKGNLFIYLFIFINNIKLLFWHKLLESLSFMISNSMTICH